MAAIETDQRNPRREVIREKSPCEWLIQTPHKGFSPLRERTSGKTFLGAIEGTRTPTPLTVRGPEPCASANSATMAILNHNAAAAPRPSVDWILYGPSFVPEVRAIGAGNYNVWSMLSRTRRRAVLAKPCGFAFAPQEEPAASALSRQASRRSMNVETARSCQTCRILSAIRQ